MYAKGVPKCFLQLFQGVRAKTAVFLVFEVLGSFREVFCFFSKRVPSTLDFTPYPLVNYLFFVNCA